MTGSEPKTTLKIDSDTDAELDRLVAKYHAPKGWFAGVLLRYAMKQPRPDEAIDEWQKEAGERD